MKNNLAILEDYRIRRLYDEKTGKKVVSRQNYLPLINIKEIQGKNYAD